MYRLETEVLTPTGLHAGPARQFVQLARRYPCEVKILFRGREYDAKSMIGVLGAGINRHDRIRIVCTGQGEEELCRALADLVRQDMNAFQVQQMQKQTENQPPQA